MEVSILRLYKYQVKRDDTTFEIGDEIRPEGENTERVKILNIVKIDTVEMLLYFYGIELYELVEKEYNYDDDV